MGEDTPLLFLESQGGLNPKDHVIVMHLGGQVTRIPLFFQQLKDAQELPALHTNGITITTNLPTRVLYRPTGCGKALIRHLLVDFHPFTFRCRCNQGIDKAFLKASLHDIERHA